MAGSFAIDWLFGDFEAYFAFVIFNLFGVLDKFFGLQGVHPKDPII